MSRAQKRSNKTCWSYLCPLPWQQQPHFFAQYFIHLFFYHTILKYFAISALGRFDEAVIEERRKAAEAMLQFTTSIPALYNSPQLKDFFRVRTHTHPVIITSPSPPHFSPSFSFSSIRGVKSRGPWIPPLCPQPGLCLPLSFPYPSGGLQTVTPLRRKRAGRPPLYPKIWAPIWA